MSTTTERENIMKCALKALEIDEAAAGKPATEGITAPRKIHGSGVDTPEKAMVNQSLLEADKSDIENHPRRLPMEQQAQWWTNTQTHWMESQHGRT